MTKPFHESIVDVLRGVGVEGSLNYPHVELDALARAIEATAIPKNHDEITKVLRAKVVELGTVHQYESTLQHIEGEKRRCARDQRRQARIDSFLD